ncbi:MAG: penicillin-binding transpeptidase domain-containing protein [Candidatus Pacebacteria bacterium]|nr:penicillin-binding transpeptidase domain-containing protein [Candidatus Paceibacterota bacterium]
MIAPHFVAYVQQLLVEKYGKDRVESGGLKVISTLDIDLQRMAEKVVQEHSVLNEEKFGVKNMALLSQDPKTGQILAMVGSKDFFDLEDEGNFNAVFGLRQPGSSFKPFAYVKAFEKGYTPDTVVFDLQTNFSNNSDPYVPVNYDHEYVGPVNLRNALAQSRNVPAVKTLYLAGLDNVINFAKECGVTTLTEKPSYYGLPLVLGGGAVNLYEMVGAYSVFAQDGVYHEQSPILKVIDYDGTVLYEYEDSYTEVIDSNYVRMLNDVLSDNVARTPLYGTYYNPMFFGNNIPVAAKTGTSQDYRGAWIFGYTPNLVTGV